MLSGTLYARGHFYLPRVPLAGKKNSTSKNICSGQLLLGVCLLAEKLKKMVEIHQISHPAAH
jgi:hypothetical protein